MEIKVAGTTVATYVVRPQLEPTMSPRPYLHPIRTLAGAVVSDAAPADHLWHMGLSLAVQDVNGTNLWGGRTYVRDRGYTWLDDHGTITHEDFDEQAPDRLVERLTWRNPGGDPLLHERRTITASLVDESSWALELGWELRADRPVTLGSPRTNGREYGAGYGGCFLRLAPDPDPVVSAGGLRGEEQVNGCDAAEVDWRAAAYTLKFSGAQRWFVRTGIYPGVCAAWAFEDVTRIEAGEASTGRFRMVVADTPGA